MVTISTTYSELDKLKYSSSIITIGSFDGLHLGHQKVFEKMNNLSSNSNKKILITFDPHPFTVLNKRQNEKYYLLESTNEKVEILNSFKNYLIDIVVIIKFDKELSHVSATGFFTKILKC